MAYPDDYVVEHAYPGDKLTYTASGAIVAGNLVEFAGDETVSAGTADTTAAAGVAINSCADGELVTVASAGVWPMVASGAISAGDRVVGAASGAVKTVPAASASYVAAEQTIPLRVVGIAQADAADGAAVKVKLTNLA